MSVGWVDFNDQVHVAQVLIAASGSVGSHHQAAVDTGRQVDMLANWKTCFIVTVLNIVASSMYMKI